MKVFTLVTSLFAAAYAAEASEAAEAAENAAQWAAYEAIAEEKPQGERILPRFKDTQPLDGAQRTESRIVTATIVSSKMYKSQQRTTVKCPFGSCLVTAMEATIRYPNGKEANVDTGAWMHHIAMFGSLGTGAAKGAGLGGLLSGGGGGGGGIWAAGNERPTLRLNSKSYKYGLDFSTYFMIIDLMSEDTKPKNVSLFVTYEVVPKTKAGYKAATMYWLTIGEPAAKQGKYHFTSMPMTAKNGGIILYAIGHMHDGGTDMELKVGGKMVCRSKMFYNAREGYGKKVGGGTAAAGAGAKSSKMSGGHSHKKRQHEHGAPGEGMHISDPGACTHLDEPGQRVSPGARLTAVANYDANKYPLMMHNGKAERLMGNMRVYMGA